MSLDQYLFNLNLSVKEMKKFVHKYQKEAQKEKQKCKEFIMKGNRAAAQIHAENAIRNSSQANNFLLLSARVEAIASKLKGAIMVKQVSKNLEGVVRAMSSAVQNMEVEKLSKTMEMFERQFENLDVQQACIEDTMGASATTSVPQNQVDMLMAEIAEEAGLDISAALPQAARNSLDQESLEKKLDTIKTIKNR